MEFSIAWPLITSDYWPNRQAYYDGFIARLTSLSQQYLKSGPDAQIHVEPDHTENKVVVAPPPAPPPPPPPPPRTRHSGHGGGDSAAGAVAATDQPVGAADGTCPGGSISSFRTRSAASASTSTSSRTSAEVLRRAARLARGSGLLQAAAAAIVHSGGMAEGLCRSEGQSVLNGRLPTDASTCNYSDERGVHHPVTASGSQKACKSAYGVADLSGNVAEWTATPSAEDPSKKMVIGGSAGDPLALIRCTASAPTPVSTQNEGSSASGAALIDWSRRLTRCVTLAC